MKLLAELEAEHLERKEAIQKRGGSNTSGQNAEFKGLSNDETDKNEINSLTPNKNHLEETYNEKKVLNIKDGFVRL